MKRLSVLMLALMLALCPIALAEAEPPEGALDIAGSFDAADWSIGGIKWLTPLDDYIQALEFGDEVLLTSPMDDIWLTRDMFVSDLDRECEVSYIYEYQTESALLCQIKISAPITGEGDLESLVSRAQALHDAIGEKCIALDEHCGFAGIDNAFEQLAAADDEYIAFYWDGGVQIGAIDGKAVIGIMSAVYDPGKGEPRFTVSLGITAKRQGAEWQDAE